jgi:hypothetical protein
MAGLAAGAVACGPGPLRPGPEPVPRSGFRAVTRYPGTHYISAYILLTMRPPPSCP